MKKYFLSYSRRDQAIALRFAVDLKAAGVAVWVDQLDIPVGQNWDRSVEAAVRVCEGLIVILSPRSATSENVADEVGVAIEDGKQIIPVLIEKCTMPMRLSRVQYIDATSDYQVAVERCASLILGPQSHAPIVRSRLVAAISAPTADKAASEPVVAPEGWNSRVLDEAVQKLLAFVGPVARLLVQKVALGTRSEAELYQRLAVAIPNETERAAFLKGAKSAPPAQYPVRSVTGSPAPSTSSALPPELVDKWCQILTVYLGPIARYVLVSEARDAKSRDELYQRLGARIPSDKERAELLAKLRSQ